MSRDYSRLRTCSGNKRVTSCKVPRSLDNVVLIDVDADGVDNVIILDTECLLQKFKRSRVHGGGKTFPLQGIIRINDDDDDDDGSDNVADNVAHSVINANRDGVLDSDDASNSPSSDHRQNSVAEDADDCCVVHEKGAELKLSECKNFSAKRASTTNSYGLDAEFESGSSQSDSSDCEIMEDTFGDLRVKWERAFQKRKSDVHGGDCGLENQAKCCSRGDTCADVDIESRTKQNPDVTTACSSSGHVEFENENCSVFDATRDGSTRGVNRKADEKSFSWWWKAKSKEKKESHLNDGTEYMGGTFNDGTECMCSTQTESHEMRNQPGASSAAEVKDPISDLKPPSGDVDLVVQRNIICEREKLKESDEYKRAVEEEWEARQRQLKIQAEEAQRMRKRKKAEILRILDMEKRQKQRVEEVRETQKKDVENLNMKERLRAEVRKELDKLEFKCIDMASLLRGLGINVGGGFSPLSQEVRAAYKRALLKFHPDRASRTDIRQQVEAEEKFKLISRMKEKFLSTSCQ